MADDLTPLYKLANQATKGRWIAVGTWVENERNDLPDIVCADFDDDRGPDDSQAKRCADAEYIAAAQPEQIKNLIAEIRALRKLVRGKQGSNKCSIK